MDDSKAGPRTWQPLRLDRKPRDRVRTNAAPVTAQTRDTVLQDLQVQVLDVASDNAGANAPHQPRTPSQPRSIESSSHMRSPPSVSPVTISNQPLLTPLMFWCWYSALVKLLCRLQLAGKVHGQARHRVTRYNMHHTARVLLRQIDAPVKVNDLTSGEVRLRVMVAKDKDVRQLPRPDGSREAVPPATRKDLNIGENLLCCSHCRSECSVLRSPATAAFAITAPLGAAELTCCAHLASNHPADLSLKA